MEALKLCRIAGALIADAKIAGDFDGAIAKDQALVSGMTFEMYHRNHPNPPKEWLERELVMPGLI